MAIVDEIEFRKATPEDLEFAYAYLFRPGIERFVRELNNDVWPDSRYDFFRKGFADPDMMMITHNGMDIGCFCISRTDTAIILQRVYLLPEYQRQGIGAKLVEIALAEAHAQQKPLELEVLENNAPAISSYKKAGFVQCSGIIVNGWNRKFEMRHKDTEGYRAPGTAMQPAPTPSVQKNMKLA